MGHCILVRGPGPYQIDTLGAIDRWVAAGQAPDKIIAVNPDTGISRPLCPYPQMAQYKGSGSIDKAGNFKCAIPDR